MYQFFSNNKLGDSTFGFCSIYISHSWIMIEIPKPEIDSIYLKTVEEPEFFIS